MKNAKWRLRSKMADFLSVTGSRSRDFFVLLGRLYMHTKFRLHMTKLAERLSLWRCHGNGESEIESFFDNY